jgi:hypothetical protein
MDIRFPTVRCACCAAAINPELPPVRHAELGRVCPECAGEHLPHAACALAEANLFRHLTAPKNNHAPK